MRVNEHHERRQGWHSSPERVLHTSLLPTRFSASAQDVANGIVRMSRSVTTGDVESYAHHVPKKEIKLNKTDSMVYKKGVLVKATGKTDLKILQKVWL